jgi:hypothetical protein
MKVKAQTLEVIDHRTKRVLIEGVERIIRVCRSCDAPRYIEHFKKFHGNPSNQCKPCFSRKRAGYKGR